LRKINHEIHELLFTVQFYFYWGLSPSQNAPTESKGEDFSTGWTDLGGGGVFQTFCSWEKNNGGIGALWRHLENWCQSKHNGFFENLIQLVNIIGSLFYGTILGIFLIAIFLKSIRANAVFYAAILTEIIVLIIFSQDWVSFLWLNVIGAVLCVATAKLYQKVLK
tara:strand:- start:213 stop:707 length:495 start_codon:yes stop_codon:yes gene_type:complete